jgi:hypothetical protein
MTIPTLLFGFVISTLIGAGFHLWRGGSPVSLLLYLILSWIGFWIGHFAGNSLDWTFGSIGQLRLGMASLTSLAFLAVGHWLSLVEVETK